MFTQCIKEQSLSQHLENKILIVTQKRHGHHGVIMVTGCSQSVMASLLLVGEDKRDLLHKGPQPGTETITSTQLDHRLYCLTHRAVEQDHYTPQPEKKIRPTG